MKGGPSLDRPTRLRRLSEEEIALWSEVARGVKRRKGAILPVAAKPADHKKPPARAAAPAASGPASAKPAARPRPPPLAPIERRLKRELKRGRGAIDAALDLHGMNQAEAHHALRAFLTRAQAEGARLAIVVTGKGGIPRSSERRIEGPGVLRRLTPFWLGEPDLRAIVLGFEEAGRAHGGAGALYVRLRRRDRAG